MNSKILCMYIAYLNKKTCSCSYLEFQNLYAKNDEKNLFMRNSTLRFDKAKLCT